MEEKQYEKGKLYQFNGSEFVELQSSADIKIPVCEAAADAVKAVRSAAQKVIKMRPELSLTASAMLLAAAEMPGIAEHVKAFGLSVYSGGQQLTPQVDTVDSEDKQQQETQETPAAAPEAHKSVSDYL